MNILVTGGAGYIGSHTCKALAIAGHNPIVYDNLTTGHKEAVQWGPFVYGDILDTPRLQDCMRTHKIEGVIHFAALSTVGESVTEPGTYYRNNVVGTLSLLEAMRLQGVPRIVVSSTCAVYGLPETLPIAEHLPLRPINPYGKTKLAMEGMLDDYRVAYGLSFACLRYFNAAGADAEGRIGEVHVPETHLIPRVLMAAWGTIPNLAVFGNDYPTPDGTCIRDYIHVTDLAEAHVLALVHLKRTDAGVQLNLGTGQGYSNQEILHCAQDILGKTIPYTFSPRRPGDPPVLVADATVASNLLHWHPQHSTLLNIISTAANWYEQCIYSKGFPKQRAS